MDINYYVRITFWRIAASITGLGVRHQNLFQKTMLVGPILIAGIIAYFLGRLLGELLMWGFSL